jgi:hypothetical protein
MKTLGLKDKELLEKSGWINDTVSGAKNWWYDPESPIDPNTKCHCDIYQFTDALEIIRARNNWKNGKPAFYVRKVYRDYYGYKVMRADTKDSKPFAVFYADDIDDCNRAVEKFNEGEPYWMEDNNGKYYYPNTEAEENYYYTNLVIFKEKYGNFIYWARTFKELLDICVFTVNRRIKEGWYETTIPKKPTLSFDRNDLVNIPIELHDSAEKCLINHKHALTQYDDNLRDQKLLQSIKDGNKNAALTFLKRRLDHQYEEFEIRKLDIFNE